MGVQVLVTPAGPPRRVFFTNASTSVRTGQLGRSVASPHFTGRQLRNRAQATSAMRTQARSTTLASGQGASRQGRRLVPHIQRERQPQASPQRDLHARGRSIARELSDKATQYLTGRKPCGPLLMPPAARNHVTTSVDGSAVLPTPVTSARLRRFFRAFHLQLERCCGHRPGRLPRVPSRFYPHMRMSHSPVRISVFFSFAGCACRSHLHRGLALAAGRLMCLVITGRRVPPRALARVCREAGARVARNVRLADMNLDVPVQDARRIEVVCNGLPLWHGEQLAVDATLVKSPRPGWPAPGQCRCPSRHRCCPGYAPQTTPSLP